jgi:hypothetical protein
MIKQRQSELKKKEKLEKEAISRNSHNNHHQHPLQQPPVTTEIRNTFYEYLNKFLILKFGTDFHLKKIDTYIHISLSNYWAIILDFKVC